jgi:hypothetical protein
MANIWSFLTTRLMQNQIIELLVRKHMDVVENERTANIPFRHKVNEGRLQCFSTLRTAVVSTF